MDYSQFGTPNDHNESCDSNDGSHNGTIGTDAGDFAESHNTDRSNSSLNDCSPLVSRNIALGQHPGHDLFWTPIGSTDSVHDEDLQINAPSTFQGVQDHPETTGITSRGCDPRENTDNHLPKPIVNEYQAYPIRWYILFLFSMLAFNQSLGWNTWGPIAASSKVAYGWGNWTISLLAAWGPVMFILTVFFFSWMVETKGLRVGCLSAAFFISLGAVLRCISTKPPYVTWLMSAGQICVSTAGPIAMAISSVISATWFPAGQRTTATAIANQVMSLGAGFPFIVGPLLVSDVSNGTNQTMDNSTEFIITLRGEIQQLMYIELGMAAFIFLAMLIYFPDKPPTPPSLSVASRQVNFQAGLRQLVRKRGFWLLGLPYSATHGIYIGWIATLDVNLQPLGVDQKTAGWIGFVGSLASVIIGIGTGRLVDVMKGRTKPILLILFTVAAASFLWLSLICFKIISFNIASLFISRTIGGTALSTMPPLVFETLCESTYPVPEAVTNGLLTLLKNFWCLVFLAVLWFPNTGTLWMNWLLAGACCMCLPLVAIYREVHGRLDIDLGHKTRGADDQIQSNSEEHGTDAGHLSDETSPLLESQ